MGRLKRTESRKRQPSRRQQAYDRSRTRELTRYVWSPRVITTDEWLTEDPLAMICGPKPWPLRLTIVPGPSEAVSHEPETLPEATKSEGSILTFISPTTTTLQKGATATEPTDGSGYAFFKHFDYGLLREGRPGSLYYEKWFPDDKTWRWVRFNPFTASMSEMPVEWARGIAGEHLYDAAAETLEPREGW